ncbi:MAG: hypothetical protein ACJAYU_003270 [Bradymonadia bacterium]
MVGVTNYDQQRVCAVDKWASASDQLGADLGESTADGIG